jgi:hypothetical protein
MSINYANSRPCVETEGLAFERNNEFTSSNEQTDLENAQNLAIGP